jgi:hypothetical protein
MRQAYQDAMAICREMGKPEWFITITANPGWKEIKQQLRPNEIYLDRPDLCVRVFMLKLKAIIDDLFKKHVLGINLALILNK